MKVIIIGIGSDIGFSLGEMYVRDGHDVIGTYRSYNSNVDRSNANRYYLDVTDNDSMIEFTNDSKYLSGWDLLIISISESKPISKFFDTTFEDWERSLYVNFTAQMKIIHSLYKYVNDVGNICLFAGMGTNNAVDEQSAVCISKIGLIKMAELIDYEYDNTNIFVIGPGYVRTKTHKATLEAANKDSKSYKKVKEWMDQGIEGTPMSDIYDHINWCLTVGKDVVGGRNMSTVHDTWGSDALSDELSADKDMYKLRRYRNNWRER